MYHRESLVSFLCKQDVIEIGPEQKGNILRVVQPTTPGIWIHAVSCLLYTLLFFCSESRVHPHTIKIALFLALTVLT